MKNNSKNSKKLKNSILAPQNSKVSRERPFKRTLLKQGAKIELLSYFRVL